MSDHGPRKRDPASTDEWPILEDFSRFESRWKSGDRGSIERSVAEAEASRIPGVLSFLIEAEVRLRREVGERPTAAEYLARFPGYAEVIEAVFLGLGETRPRETGEVGPASGRDSTEQSRGGDGESATVIGRASTQQGGEPTRARPTRPSSPRDGCRYRIVDRHDGGGLGEVYLADDLELNRSVALKEIRERLARDPQARARFELEAEVIGKLEHPGIVPVYGKGRYGDGRLYYAMKFIQGESFREAIDRHHKGREGRPRSEHELMFRELLGRVVDACNAIEYAHSRGVLHRDIKPRNIMLGRFGETLVVDWGLAKVLGMDWDADAMDFPFRPLAGEGLDPTRMDKALGTLRYMCPEQAAGKLDAVGPTSDVFGLGATLYCLLTGRAPYIGSDPDDLRGRAIEAESPPARQVRRDVPAPLESICLKAMDRDPEERYPSARAMADDLERWLADEPVSAHRYPIAARASRWARRHRTLVGVVAALLITLSFALVVSNVMIRAAERRANDNFKLALEAVDQMLERVSDKGLIYVPQMTDLRSELGDEAASFFKKLLDQRPDDPKLRKKYAEICLKASNYHMLAGRMDRVFEYHDRMISTYRSLIAEDPKKLSYVDAMVASELSRAEALLESGQIRAAIAQYREAVDESERLDARGPRSPYSKYTLARARLLLGEALILVGDYREALARIDSATEILTPLVRDTPIADVFSQDYRRYLVYSCRSRGLIAAETADPAGAKAAFDRGHAELDDWAKHPQVAKVEVDYCRARLLIEQGRWLASGPGSLEAAERAGDWAVRLLEELSAKFPGVPQYGIDRASALLNRGLARSGMGAGMREPGEVDLDRAVEILGPLVRDHPTIASGRSILGRAEGACGRSLLDRGDRDLAIPMLRRAVLRLQEALEVNGANPRDGKARKQAEDDLRRAGVAP